MLPPLSLRHSGVFLIGFLPAILILLAWADSVEHHTNWYHRLEGHRTLCFITSESKFRVEWISREPGHRAKTAPPVPIYGGIHRFGAMQRDKEGNPLPIVPALDWRDEEATHRAPGFHVDTFVIPLWFVLVCYLPVWLGISCLHVRRKWKRLRNEVPQLYQPSP